MTADPVAEPPESEKPALSGAKLTRAIPVAFFREHPGLLITASYLLLIVVGLIYEVWLFFRFRLNILYYAEATDFLLVPFREPLVMLVTIAPIPLYVLYIRTAKWIGSRLPFVRSRWRDAPPKSSLAISVLAVFLWAVAFSANYAQYVDTAIREGRRKSVTIELVTGGRVVGPLLGTTNQFVFVFDRTAKQTHVLQIENVARVIVDSPPRPRD